MTLPKKKITTVLKYIILNILFFKIFVLKQHQVWEGRIYRC